MLFDSDIDGKSDSIFRKKILNHGQLYFIAIDLNDNVFGHYYTDVIDTVGRNYSYNLFMFTLNSNGRCGVMKFDSEKHMGMYTSIYSRDDYCGYDYAIVQLDTNYSWINKDIVDDFEGVEKTTLTGNCSPEYFTTKRVIVIQMK